MTTIASATDDTIQVITRDKGQKGDTGTQGLDGAGFDTVRSSLLDSPLFRFGVPNKIAHTLKGSLTVTRASTATYIDRFGVVKTAAINEAREEKEGPLIEPQSTNLLTYSDDFTNAAWITSGIVTANSVTAPDGTLTADTFDPNGGNFSSIAQSVSSSGNVAFSVFAKKGTSDVVTLRVVGTDVGGAGNDRSVYEFNFNTELFTKRAGGDALQVKIESLYDDWYRLSLSVSTSTVTSVILYSDFANPSNGTVYFWGAQLEALPRASSYIPTTTAAATRLSDQISAQGDGNAPLLSGAYSVYLKVDVIGYNNFNSLFNIGSSNNSSDKMGAFIASNGNVYSSMGGDVNKFNQPSNILGQQVDYCLTSSGVDYRQYIDGLADDNNPVTATAPPITIPDRIAIGSNYDLISGYLWGHIKDFRIYDFELNADEVAYLSGAE